MGQYNSDCPRKVTYEKIMRLLINKVNDNPSLLDTSDLCRTEFFLKEKEAFRDYSKEDEIGQRVKRTYTEIPDGGLWAIRFHPCYPWHTGRDYQHLEAEQDPEILD